MKRDERTDYRGAGGSGPVLQIFIVAHVGGISRYRRYYHARCL